MFRAMMACAAALALGGCVTAGVETSATDPAEGSANTAEANGSGAVAMFSLLDADAGPKENVFYSPLSVDYAFSILALGARGETAAQLAEVLPEPLPPEAYAHNANGAELRLASRLWIERQFSPSRQYLAEAQKRFDAGMEQIDKTKPAEGAERINKWADKATNGLIPNIIRPDDIDDRLSMIITNAIYFDANWAVKFGGWEMEPFLHGDGTDKPFKIMAKRDNLATVDRGDWRAIRLSYRDPRFAMDVIMPEDREVMAAPPSLEAIADFGNRLDQAKPKLVDMKLPQFEIETDFGLIDPLQKLGITLPFSPSQADLSGMVEGGGKGLFVGGAKQLAKLQVFDTGTKAAAVTVISIVTTGARAPDRRKAVKFTVDRPFIVVLRDLENDAVLFLGRISDPKAFEPEEGDDGL